VASHLSTVPQTGRKSADTRRIAQLAEQSAIFEAQRWFARERTWINEQQLQLCRIPAATFFEQPRAEWFRDQLATFGWASRLDRAGNVLATVRLENEENTSVVVSAHLDTVLAPSRPEEVYFAPDGRLFGPGASDNGSGLAALLALARVLRDLPDLGRLAESILLVANVGEEGEGNLSGMRYLCRRSRQLERTKAFIVLDGPFTEHITTQALASRRYEISFTGAGGHSWNDYGTPNPVHAVSDCITLFLQTVQARMGDRRGRCSYNFGVIEGGTSINSIPSSARSKLDVRSEDPEVLEEINGFLTSAVEKSLERENRSAKASRLSAKVKDLGSRPGGKLSEGSELLRTVQSVDAYLQIRSRVDCASTDANVPLSMGIPAISIGAGGSGGGAHTRQEWYHPDGRELGLRRVLLLMAALADTSGSAGE
jgi:acetylornithine deacetylase/succinyl-diaminopimelate desuccinylase-like protein